MYYKLGDLEQAHKFLSEAIELDFDPEIIAHLGEVLWAMGREDDAREMWQKGLVDMPDSEVILETRSRLSGK